MGQDCSATRALRSPIPPIRPCRCHRLVTANGESQVGRGSPVEVGPIEGVKLKQSISTALCAALAVVWPGSVAADADSARNRASAWLLRQQSGSGAWSATDGALPVQSTAAALIALRHSGLSGAPSAAAGMAWLANAEADSVDALARKVQALAAPRAGAPTQAEADRLFAKRSVSTSAIWGGYGGAGIDLVDTALALAALRVGDANYGAKASNALAFGFCELLGARAVNGGGRSAWSTTPPAPGQSAQTSRPSVIATALLAAELRAMQLRLGGNMLNCGNGQVSSMGALSGEAVSWLLDQQNTADGGWGEQRSDGTRGPSNVLATAWVYHALASQAGVPAQAGAAMAWLLAQQDASGSWRGDAFVTANVLVVLPAAAGAHALDTDRDGLTDVVEAQLGSNPVKLDGRSGIGPGLPGITLSAQNLTTTTRQAFSHALGPGDSFSIVSGSLPPGITLNVGTGQLSGVATQAGSYSFDYTFKADGAPQLQIARIDVYADTPLSTDGDVPLPLWSLLLLAGSLAGVLRRRQTGGQTRAPSADADVRAKDAS